MVKHSLTTAHNAKVNELTVCVVTDLSSSTFDEPALAKLMRQGSQHIPIVFSQKKIKFTI